MVDGADEGSGLCLGIEIGGTKLQILAGEGSNIRERLSFSVEKASGGEGIRRQLQKVLPAFAQKHRPRRIGVGFGGPVDWPTGHICCSHQIEGWSGFPLGPWLSELTHAPAIVDNDANVAALGEARHGAGTGLKIVFYATLGSGVGGGLVQSGSIYHGAKPGEAELGHLRLDRTGLILEEVCSGWAVDRRIRAEAKKNPNGPLGRLCEGAAAHEAKFLAGALAAQDSAARAILHETADALAFGLSHVVHLFHPEIIVLGGGLSLIGEPFRAAVQERLHAYLMAVFKPGPKIALSELREDAVPVGALCLASCG
jgi:glucokinase